MSSLNVFVLDDDPKRVEWFKKTFASSFVDATDNVQEAFNLLSAKKYDIIFLDHDLSNPHQSGEQLAWEMAQHKIASSTPIVVYSMSKRGSKAIARDLELYHNNFAQIRFHDLTAHSFGSICSMFGIKCQSEEKQASSTKECKQSQSILDMFLNNLEIVQNGHNYKVINQAREKAAKALFSVWQKQGNKITDHVFRKPSDVSDKDVELMSREGFVRTIGDKIEITAKGSQIIKTMILGDHRSIFDKSYGQPIELKTAEDDMHKKKASRTKCSSSEKIESDWWNEVLSCQKKKF